MSDDLSPPAGPKSAALMAGRATRLASCACGAKIEYRWTDPTRIPTILDGVRGGFRAAIPCACGRVNVRHSTDLVRYARTIGQFHAPEVMLGLQTVAGVLLARMAEGRRAANPDPDKAVPKGARKIEDRDLALFARSFKAVSELEARLSGYLVERIEVTHVDEGSDADPALEEVRRQIVKDAASRLGVTVLDADFEEVRGKEGPADGAAPDAAP